MSSFGGPRIHGKFYTGSSRSEPWVKDLLWARYCEKEGKDYGFDDITPPMMSFYRGDAAMVDRLPTVASPTSEGSGKVAQLEDTVQSQVRACVYVPACERLVLQVGKEKEPASRRAGFVGRVATSPTCLGGSFSAWMSLLACRLLVGCARRRGLVVCYW
jgi:hypothetical protein